MRRLLACLPVLAALAACSPAGDSRPSSAAPAHIAGVAEASREETVEVPPPPFSDGIFPCSGCHADLPVNRERRPLTEMHAEIELAHDEQHRWCLDCHDAADRDVLHLAGGERLPFERSYLLCGQCHGEKLRDWRAGVHGRRTGEWNGRKEYLLCAHCHDPHQPRFRAIAPAPAPRRPQRAGPPPGAGASAARAGLAVGDASGAARPSGEE